jgi:hypothetical protein
LLPKDFSQVPVFHFQALIDAEKNSIHADGFRSHAIREA